MGVIIKMQSYKDYKDGLITEEELLEGQTVLGDPTLADLQYDRELDEALDELFDEVSDHNVKISKKIDWSKQPHHEFCCCNKCAPTREDLHKQVDNLNKEVERRRQEKIENLAPSDCEPE